MESIKNPEFNEQQAKDILGNITIPPCPQIMVALQDSLRQPETDFNNLARLINSDISLAASMLKTANSPFFGLRRKVDTVPMAVSVLGLKNITQITRGFSLRQAFGSYPSLDKFWERSNLNAIAAAKIAAELPDLPGDIAYTYGLFHDCGIPVLMQKFPDYSQRLSTIERSVSLIIGMEEQAYNTNHAIIGSMLARAWLLPANLCQAILLHHDHSIFTNSSTDSEICTFVAVTLIAEHITATFLELQDEAEWHAGGHLAMEYLGYTENEVNGITEDILAELDEHQAYQQNF